MHIFLCLTEKFSFRLIEGGGGGFGMYRFPSFRAIFGLRHMGFFLDAVDAGRSHDSLHKQTQCD